MRDIFRSRDNDSTSHASAGRRSSGTRPEVGSDRSQDPGGSLPVHASQPQGPLISLRAASCCPWRVSSAAARARLSAQAQLTAKSQIFLNILMI